MNPAQKIREIPYNYTSFSDREIVIRFLGAGMWDVLNELRGSRRTGRSARMLFEILGDLWVITRNPLIQDDLLANRKRLDGLLETMEERLQRIESRRAGNTLVLSLVQATQRAVERFAAWFPEQVRLRQRIGDRLAGVTHPDNIDFSGVARVAHMTDATDWRVSCPAVVITPATETEVAPIVAACIDLGLTIIPRGGGTGYTGSGVPLHSDSAMINTERLDGIGTVEKRSIPEVAEPVFTLHVEAGAVTKRVAEVAEAAGCVFAVDPTSQNASTIGGNIAMNAGGKKAVLWGTTLDNLVSWRLVAPNGDWLEVERLGHNRGKIHDVPHARFRISRYDSSGNIPVGEPKVLTLSAEEIRKPGLGKDVTNKFLGGLPGVQKEGCDGLISSAVFLLHTMPRHTQTVCMEFFGPDLGRVVPAIVETKTYLDDHPDVGCAGLEHLDERYIRAIGYNTKAARGELPKMVLLADLVGEDEKAVSQAAAHVVQLTVNRGGAGFIAVTPQGRERFWADRSRTAAIAAHTNAFKINEDIVIPLERLADYSAGIERLNIEYSIRNKLRMVDAVRAYLESDDFLDDLPSDYPSSDESEIILADKRRAALERLQRVADRWQRLMSHFDSPVDSGEIPLTDEERALAGSGETLIALLLRRDLRISYRREVARALKNLFTGDLWSRVHAQLDTIHQRLRTNRLFAALHMHAGDGNVHTNIPVNSNDYAMLGEADGMVDRIMKLATDLGGRVSGEHGIGLTKFRFLDEKTVADFAAYKQRVDPQGVFNRGKLLPGATLEQAYTPSLRLVQQEALLLRESTLGALNDDIRNCLRCGKCKAVCTTHDPRSHLLYSPRNKILATGLVIEAFLYEEQTRRGIALRHFDEMTDVADHCTVCHRCVVPCPVDIDFGLVTMRMRAILKERGKLKKNIASRLALDFLTNSDPRLIGLARRLFIQWGYAAQRLGHQLVTRLLPGDREKPPGATCGPPTIHSQLLHMVKTPLPTGLGPHTARARLDLEDQETIPVLKAADTDGEFLESVFYFPGCGCERLFSEISLATMALLRHIGVQTVLPPGYLCCGFPQATAGDEASSRRISTGNRVLFHRVANAVRDLEIKTVLVSCGTCLGQLETYRFEEIFPDGRLMDVHEYLMEKGVRTETGDQAGFLYHQPCHSPMKRHDPLTVVTTLTGARGRISDRCCGEAGTFAVARPDIATQVRHRKTGVLKDGQQRIDPHQQSRPTRLFTACPSCYQGLSRYRQDLDLQTRFLAVELAERILGETWKEDFIDSVGETDIEKVLF